MQTLKALKARKFTILEIHYNEFVDDIKLQLQLNL